MKTIGVIGAGSFGTSLAILLTKKGYNVKLWGRKKAQLDLMRETLENPHYLPGIKLPAEMGIVDEMKDAVENSDIVLFSVPTQTFRGVFSQAKEWLGNDAIVVNVAKGIEKGSLLRMSEVAEDVMPGVKYVALSGPSHAEEVARMLPTTVAVASKDEALAKAVQEVFNTDRFRVYTNEDIVGVELGGALKNIIALGAGISDGMKFGDNAKAAIMTRGITEICRLGVSVGANVNTFSGLTGIGDLIVTCTSMHSRNRRCGIMIGEGVEPAKAIEDIGMVVEGITTAEAAYDMAQKCGIEMPITECIYKVIHGELDAKAAVEALMNREMKNEMRIF